MNNAEWMIQNGYKFRDIRVCYELDKIITFSLNGAIVGTAPYNENDTCLATVIAWLEQEHKEPILDDAEKRYLSAIIRPFRDKVLYIAKRSTMDRRKEHIYIDLTHDVITLPRFMEGTMYKGMKADKEYTLKELGL